MIDLKNAALALALAAMGTATCSATAAEPVGQSGTAPADDRQNIGYSFFVGLGGQTASYEERSSLLPVRSRARLTSPLIISGALYAIDADVLFSLSNVTTFAPGDTTERWTATSDNFAGQTLTDRVVQRNGFSLTQNTTQLLGYYRLTGPLFAVGGAALHTQTFKRYSFTAGADQAVALPTDRTIEESTNEILASLGVALESERVHGKDSHYGLRALVALPVWRRTDNTGFPDEHFKSASGYELALEGRYSRAIYKDIHAGLWGQWTTSERNRSTHGSLELPRGRLTTFSYGLELLWKL